MIDFKSMTEDDRKEVRLYRKEPHKEENSHITRYRIAKPGYYTEVKRNGDTVVHQLWNVYIEGCENIEGFVFCTNRWKSILEKYDVVEDNLTESLPE